MSIRACFKKFSDEKVSLAHIHQDLIVFNQIS